MTEELVEIKIIDKTSDSKPSNSDQISPLTKLETTNPEIKCQESDSISPGSGSKKKKMDHMKHLVRTGSFI
jgi:hypothetical protein